MATENMDTKNKRGSHEAFAAAPGSAWDATTAASVAVTLRQLADQMETQARAYAEGTGRLRRGMDEVAALLEHSVAGLKSKAQGLRYDDPPNLRLSLEVTISLLRDLARELRHPGSTKYSPNGIELSDAPRQPLPSRDAPKARSLQ